MKTRAAEPERYVPCSGHIALQCECGEILVLLGQEEDWRAEGRTDFECECGKALTLADRAREDRPLP